VCVRRVYANETQKLEEQLQQSQTTRSIDASYALVNPASRKLARIEQASKQISTNNKPHCKEAS